MVDSASIETPVLPTVQGSSICIHGIGLIVFDIEGGDQDFFSFFSEGVGPVFFTTVKGGLENLANAHHK